MIDTSQMRLDPTDPDSYRALYAAVDKNFAEAITTVNETAIEHYNRFVKFEQSDDVKLHIIHPRHVDDSQPKFKKRKNVFYQGKLIIALAVDDHMLEEMERQNNEPLEEWLEVIRMVIEDNMSFIKRKRVAESDKEHRVRVKRFLGLEYEVMEMINNKSRQNALDEGIEYYNSEASKEAAKEGVRQHFKIEEENKEKASIQLDVDKQTYSYFIWGIISVVGFSCLILNSLGWFPVFIPLTIFSTCVILCSIIAFSKSEKSHFEKINNNKAYEVGFKNTTMKIVKGIFN